MPNIFRVCVVGIWQKIELTLVNFRQSGNFSLLKMAKWWKNNLPSGHTGVNIKYVVILLNDFSDSQPCINAVIEWLKWTIPSTLPNQRNSRQCLTIPHTGKYSSINRCESCIDRRKEISVVKYNSTKVHREFWLFQ